MTMFYDAATGGFYSAASHGARQIAAPQSAAEVKAGKRPAMIDNPACRIPPGAVEISAERHAQLMDAQADGHVITASIDGMPMALPPLFTDEQRAVTRRATRDRLLVASDWTQLPDASPPGGAEVWAKYRQALRDLDMAGADWPAVPN